MAARMKGLLGSLGLLMIVVGVPVLLWTLGIHPLPSDVPSFREILDGLLSPDDGTFLLLVFGGLAWLAWLFIAFSVVVEIISRLAGVETPRIPGLALPQGIARGLVGTAALLFVAAPVVGQATAAQAAVGPASPTPTTAASVSAVALGASEAAAVASVDVATPAPQAAEDSPQHATVDHVVEQGDTLWSLAEKHLGDGARYPEIVHANPGTISSSHWLATGTTIQIPVDEKAEQASSPAHEVVVERGDTLSGIAERELGDADRYPELVTATQDEVQPGGARLTDPDLILPGWTISVPGDGSGTESSSDRAAATRTSSNPDAARTTPDVPERSDAAIFAGATGSADVQGDLDLAGFAGAVAADAPTTASGPVAAPQDEGPGLGSIALASVGVLGLGGLTASGLVGLLALRRQQQQRRRGPGEALPLPAGRLVEVESALRDTAEREDARTVDLALRHLAAAFGGGEAPAVRSVLMTPGGVDVHLAAPTALPAPWTVTADPTIWTLHAERAAGLDLSSTGATPPPYPALVSLGRDHEGAHLLVDLQQAGVLKVAGPAQRTRSAIVAVAVDLATSAWATSVRVTVVGGQDDLAQVLGTDRLRPAADVDAAVEMVEQDTDPVVHVVLVSGDATIDGSRRLTDLATARRDVCAVIATRDFAPGEWALDLREDEQLGVVSPMYLQVHAQRLPDDVWHDIRDLFALASAPALAAASPWAPVEEPTLAGLTAARVAEGYLDDALEDVPTRVRNTGGGVEAGDTPRTLWNTPVPRPVGGSGVVRGVDGGMTPRVADWLVPSVTPTPGTPVPPVVPFPTRISEHSAPKRLPFLRLLGPVDLENVPDIDHGARTRLTELTAYLAINPGVDRRHLDDALWPNRAQADISQAREAAITRLGDWLAATPGVEGALLHEDGATLSLDGRVATDWGLWTGLLPDGPQESSDARLEQALGLVRGRPFIGTHPRQFAWAEGPKQMMVAAVVDAAAELARRCIDTQRYDDAIDAALVGLTVEPAVERLWRLRIVAADRAGQPDVRDEAVSALVTLCEAAGGRFEPETSRLLDELQGRTSAWESPLTPEAGQTLRVV